MPDFVFSIDHREWGVGTVLSVDADGCALVRFNVSGFEHEKSVPVESLVDSKGTPVDLPSTEVVGATRAVSSASGTDSQSGARSSTGRVELRFNSYRNRKIGLAKRCQRCRRMRRPVWRYTDTNQGSVEFCADCKPPARRRASGGGKGEVWLIYAGRLESNRRLH